MPTYTYSEDTKLAEKFKTAVFDLMESEKYGMDAYDLDFDNRRPGGGDFVMELNIVEALRNGDAVGEYDTGEDDDEAVIWKRAHEFYDELTALCEKHGAGEPMAYQNSDIGVLLGAELWTPNNFADEDELGASTGLVEWNFTELCKKKKKIKLTPPSSPSEPTYGGMTLDELKADAEKHGSVVHGVHTLGTPLHQ